jgi:phosphosulfolactate phosphohydrolase-like enzyme
MSSLWDTVFIQVLDRTGPLMLNLSGAPDVTYCSKKYLFSVAMKLRFKEVFAKGKTG